MLLSRTIGLLFFKDMKEPLEIMDPVPVGKWIKVSLLDNGRGLLFTEQSQKYFSVETIGEV